jgi:hypothetical protein
MCTVCDIVVVIVRDDLKKLKRGCKLESEHTSEFSIRIVTYSEGESVE